MAGSGRQSIYFWKDARIPSLPSFKIPIAKPVNSEINMVADIIDGRTGQWYTQKMVKEIPQEVVNAIMEISLPRVERADQLVWH